MDYTLEVQNILTNYIKEEEVAQQNTDTGLLPTLVAPLNNLLAFFKKNTPEAKTSVYQSFSGVKDFMSKTFTLSIKEISTVDKTALGITSWFKTSFTSITEGLGSLASTVLSSLSKALASAAKFIQGFIPTIRGFFNNLQHQTIFGIPLPTIFMWSVIACFVAWVFSKLAKMFSSKRREDFDFAEIDSVFLTEATDLPSVILKRVFSIGVTALVSTITSKMFSKPAAVDNQPQTETVIKTESYNMKLSEGIADAVTWTTFLVILTLVILGIFVFFNFQDILKMFGQVTNAVTSTANVSVNPETQTG